MALQQCVRGWRVRARQVGSSSVHSAQQLDGQSHQLKGGWRYSSTCTVGTCEAVDSSSVHLAQQLDDYSHQPQVQMASQPKVLCT